MAMYEFDYWSSYDGKLQIWIVWTWHLCKSYFCDKKKNLENLVNWWEVQKWIWLLSSRVGLIKRQTKYIIYVIKKYEVKTLNEGKRIRRK